MVMSWLINSMSYDIEANFLLYGIEKEIGNVAKETYPDDQNTIELFEKKRILHDLRQGDQPISQFFNQPTWYL